MSADLNADLEQRWHDLTSWVVPEVRSKWWQKIHTAYTAPVRHYHTLRHLSAMFKLFDRYKDDLKNRVVVAFAIFFHDIVYDPKSADNEKNSVVEFRSFAHETTIDQANVIAELIEATGSHLTAEHLDIDSAGLDDIHYFLDFDMAILGAEPRVYDEYKRQIRQEYGHLDEKAYNQARSKVLTMFLQIPKIFSTDTFRNELEQQARANIQKEIDELSASS